ncbi:selenide, water dikinase SelD [bacterium]|nr:selenide, water dikinase SelD [bacterium]
MVMARGSMALGHCICNPRQPCPCDALINDDLCPCAGERPDSGTGEIRLTRLVKKPGCASKINRSDLSRVLEGLPHYPDPNVLVGVAAGDDAGVYKLEGDYNLVQTVDVFSPVVDDPYLFGRIAAANSVSDIYAMGGRPICALSIIGFPIEELPHAVMAEILRGGIDAMWEAGVSVIGGHSINDSEIKCGFAVSGLVEGMGGITNSGARPGDQLVLTKPIGTGVLSFGAQIGRVSEAALALAGESMAALNRDAAELMLQHGAHACTDVTGFGLAGHLAAICEHSRVSARLELSAVPFFAEAVACARHEIIPGAVERNRESYAAGVRVMGEGEACLVDLLYDAQTSGGLLVALPPEWVDDYIHAMQERGHEETSWIGEIIEPGPRAILVALGEPLNLIGEYREPAPAEPASVVAQTSCCDDPPVLESSPACCGESGAMSREETVPSNAQQAAETFRAMMKAAGEPGLVDARTKKLVAIALSIVEKCEPCLKHHVRSARDMGISMEEIEEIAWLATSFSGCTGRMFYQEQLKELS